MADPMSGRSKQGKNKSLKRAADLAIRPPTDVGYVHPPPDECEDTQAAIKAGYSPDTAYSSGQRLLKNVEVAAAITEREADIANQLGLTKQRILEALWDAYQRALAVPDGRQLSVAVKCLELLLRHRGMLTDRQQVEVAGTVTYTLDLGNDLEPGDLSEQSRDMADVELSDLIGHPQRPK
jgi:hypothetical protein